MKINVWDVTIQQMIEESNREPNESSKQRVLLDWELTAPQQEYLDFCRKVVGIWRTHPVFQRRHFFQGRSIRGSDVRDITWLSATGKEMSDSDWQSDSSRCLGVLLSGDLIDEVDEQGQQIVGETMLMLMNSSPTDVAFTLPTLAAPAYWSLVLDTTRPKAKSVRWPKASYLLTARSVALLQLKQTWPERVKRSVSRIRGKAKPE